jgi:hypothetical protein
MAAWVSRGRSRPGKQFRGSRRRLRQIGVRANTPVGLWIYFLLTLLAAFVIAAWSAATRP